jgi:hypothetical protein
VSQVPPRDEGQPTQRLCPDGLHLRAHRQTKKPSLVGMDRVDIPLWSGVRTSLPWRGGAHDPAQEAHAERRGLGLCKIVSDPIKLPGCRMTKVRPDRREE